MSFGEGYPFEEHDEGLPQEELPAGWEEENNLEELAAQHIGELETEDLSSSEDVLRKITDEIRQRFEMYGIEGSKAADHERLSKLWYEMDMSGYLLEDLVFFTLSHKQRVTGDTFTKVKMSELEEISDMVSNNPYRIRTQVVEDITPHLVDILGFDKQKAYRWAQDMGHEDRSQAVRRLGWLIAQPFMHDYPQIVRSEEAAKRSRLTFPQLLSLATKEVSRQRDIHRRNTAARRQASRVSYELERYEQIEKSLENTLNMCKLAFLGR